MSEQNMEEDMEKPQAIRNRLKQMKKHRKIRSVKML